MYIITLHNVKIIYVQNEDTYKSALLLLAVLNLSIALEKSSFGAMFLPINVITSKYNLPWDG